MNEQLSMLLGLGPNAEWPYSEKSLIEIINLQREKEVTKQLYYKVENTNKSIELLNRCLSSNIPPYLIPMVFSHDGLSEETVNKLSQGQPAAAQSQQARASVPAPQQHPRPSQPQQPSQQRPLYAQYQTETSHLAPPVTLHTRRPNSPAKIGAAAVSQLDRGRYPSSPMHRRNQSVPHLNSNNNTPKRSEPTSPSKIGVQQSMMGTIGPIQFISENPGSRKRRRSSLDVPNEGDEEDTTNTTAINEEKENQEKPTLSTFRPLGHSRTKSENFILDRQRAIISPKKPDTVPIEAFQPGVKPSDIKKAEAEKVHGTTAGSSAKSTPGPNFANNILSST